MIKFFTLVLVCLPGIFLGQEVTFFSPFTQDFQSGSIESINRTISISDNEIRIITDTPEGKDIYSLMILEIAQKAIDGKPQTIFQCETKDGVYRTKLIYSENEGAPYIDVFQPALENPKRVERFRFLLD